MTTTPTQEPARAGELELKLLARDIHHALCDAGVAPLRPSENHEMRETILRVLCARHLAAPINHDAVDSKLTGAQTAACDMGELCIGCTPRRADGSCPDAQPAVAEGVEVDEIDALKDLRDRAWKQAEHHSRGNEDNAATRCRTQFNALGKAIAALSTPQPAAQESAVDRCVASITLPQAQALVDYFGGSNTEVLLYDFPEGRITDDDGAPCPAGLYAVCAECPDEGATYLGDHDPEIEVTTPQPESAQGERGAVEMLREVLPYFEARENFSDEPNEETLIASAIRGQFTTPHPGDQNARAVDLLDVARATGLRGFLHGLNATDARELLTRFVAALPAPVAQVGDGVAKNAARYMWLRNPANNVAEVIDKVTGETPMSEDGRTGGYLHYEYRAGDELDAAIDAAIARTREGGEGES